MIKEKLDTCPILTHPLAYIDRQLQELRREPPKITQPKGSLRWSQEVLNLILTTVATGLIVSGFIKYLNAPPTPLDSYPDKTYYASAFISGKDITEKQPVLTFNQGLITTVSEQGLVAPTFNVRINVEALNNALADPDNAIKLPSHMAPVIVFTDQRLKYAPEDKYHTTQVQVTQLLNDRGDLGSFRRQHPQEAFPPVVISVLDQLNDIIEGYQTRGDKQHEPNFYLEQLNRVLSAGVLNNLFREIQGKGYDPLETAKVAYALATKYNHPFQVTYLSPRLFGMLPKG